MSANSNRWLGVACVVVNGLYFGDGLLTGSVGGLGSLANPDSPASLATAPGSYLAFMAIYAALTALGVWLIVRPAPATDEAKQ